MIWLSAPNTYAEHHILSLATRKPVNSRYDMYHNLYISALLAIFSATEKNLPFVTVSSAPPPPSHLPVKSSVKLAASHNVQYQDRCHYPEGEPKP